MPAGSLPPGRTRTSRSRLHRGRRTAPHPHTDRDGTRGTRSCGSPVHSAPSVRNGCDRGGHCRPRRDGRLELEMDDCELRERVGFIAFPKVARPAIEAFRKMYPRDWHETRLIDGTTHPPDPVLLAPECTLILVAPTHALHRKRMVSGADAEIADDPAEPSRRIQGLAGSSRSRTYLCASVDRDPHLSRFQGLRPR